MSKNSKFLLILALAVIPICAGSALLLTGVFGPSDDGLRCTRTSGEAVCQVLQSRFFGLFGNSAFTVPEAAIRGARSDCGTVKVGGHGGPNCVVSLILESGPYPNYPVLSYTRIEQAEASAQRLNNYFRNKSIPSIEIKEDILTPVVLFGGVPILFAAIIMGLRWRLRLRRSQNGKLNKAILP